MQRQSRNSYDDRTRIRNSKGNNINIQINVNMKEKNSGFTGKKIDNYVDIEQKSNSKVQANYKITQEKKKNNKRTIQTAQKKFEKEKDPITPSKLSQHQKAKTNKNTIEKTPQKRSLQKRQERSKSTNQKGLRRKSAKSLVNIKTGYNFTKNKGDSRSSSADKSRSHSKSTKQLIKSNDSSLKNIFVFSNSGIKKKMMKANQIKEKGKDLSRQKQKNAFQKQIAKDQKAQKIKKYMQQKKKKQKKQRSKLIKQEKQKKEKVRQQMKKVQIQRKANASKGIPPKRNQFSSKQDRYPIVFDEDDDGFDESNDYDRLNQQAQSMVHDSPTPKRPLQTVQIQKKIDNLSSSKKSIKRKKHGLVHKYLVGNISAKQLEELSEKIIQIQAFWRGYRVRKNISKLLNDESIKIKYIKRSIDNKNGGYWNDNQQNSIIQVQRQGASPNFDSQFSISQNPISNQNSNLSYGSYNSGQKQQRFKKLSIQLDQQMIQKIRQQKDIINQNEASSIMQRQIDQLKRKLQQQNQKYRSLQQQNKNLKQNIKNINTEQEKKQNETKKIQKNDDMANSHDWNSLKMPKKIQSPLDSQTNKQKIKQLQIKIETQTQKNNQQQLNTFKKKFQAYECSSPSNAVLEQQLKTLKKKNVQGMFRRKILKVQQSFEKNAEKFNSMLKNRQISPRTYNVKKKQLQTKLQDQKKLIQQRKQQAQRVVGFIADLSSQDDKIQNAQPTKQSQLSSSMNFSKNKSKQPIQLMDHQTNTSPHQFTHNYFKTQDNYYIKKQYKGTNKYANDEHSSSYSSEQQKIYRKYWTDDMQEVRRHTQQITKKIDQALKADTDQQNSKKSLSQGYRSQGNQATSNNQVRGIIFDKGYIRNMTEDIQLHQPSQNIDEEIDQQPQEQLTQSQKKVRDITRIIDLNEQIQCKSQDESLQNSHDNICKLLNERPRGQSPKSPKQGGENLFISEAEFNKKKRKDQQLSRSSSFDKSNRSLSANNSKISKGFITNLTFIKQFCISICEFIRNHPTYKQHFISNITQPIQYDFEKYLQSYRQTTTGDLKNNYNSFMEDYTYPYFKIIALKQQPLTNQLFQDFMKCFQQQKATSPRWTQSNANKLMKQLKEFFLVSIIDAFNESLQFQKPGSIYGSPLPWLNNNNILKNNKVQTLKTISYEDLYASQNSQVDAQTQQQKRLDQLFGSSIAKVIQWGSSLCGFIPDPMPMQMGDSQIANLSDEQLNSIRQNRVGLMLQKWLLEEEQKITDANAEFTEVLLALGEKITDLLLLQCAQQVADL